ncbi:MAG: glucosaminidase domain-containing protein [Bacteroidia bacterium]|nr:glucosaminidase domain-containing protein [Bacteroidia bacterium]
MKKLYFKIILILFAFLTTTPLFSQQKKMTAADYIKTYSSLAVKEMKRSGVPASITLAQGIHESDNGNSDLAREANNHFGIKCHSTWTGKKMYKDDDEKNECFRKYKTAEESFRDHSDFLKNTKRYAFLFDLDPTDYKAWAKGLKTAGYATNPKYPELIISTIEDNNLQVYDRDYVAENKNTNFKKHKSKKLGDVDNYSIKAGREIFTKNRRNYIIIKKGDTFFKFASEFDLSISFLHKCNDMDKDDPLKEGQIFFVQKKRNRAERASEFHIAKQGETIWSVSQFYGIKLNKLYKKNKMRKGEEPKEGQKLWLRKTKDSDG